MAWNTHETVVYRGNVVDDPNDIGAGMVEVEIGIYELNEWLAEGAEEEYDEGTEVNTSSPRGFSCETLGFEKEAQAGDAEYQDWGDLAKLRFIFQRLPYRWIHRTYRQGTDHSDGPIPRTAIDGTDTLWNLRGVEYLAVGEVYPYDPPGLLPYPVKAVGSITADREEGGFYTCSFEMQGEEYD